MSDKIKELPCGTPISDMTTVRDLIIAMYDKISELIIEVNRLKEKVDERPSG